jgi:glycosyltransferase involved in cell wall biosynthesis
MIPREQKISVLVVIHNEEGRLEKCLSALTFADQLVLVLDKCTDGSLGIAEKYANKIIEGEWDLEGARRNLGIEACDGPWVLEIDADEIVCEDLASEIIRVIELNEADLYDIPVDNYVNGRLVKHGWGASFGRGAHTALFRKGYKKWGNERVHPSLTFMGRRGPRLNIGIRHHVAENISGLIAKLDAYSSANAMDLRDKKNIGTFRHNFRRIFSRFYKCFVVRRGYREGSWGFLIALLAGLYPILSYLKAKLEEK